MSQAFTRLVLVVGDFVFLIVAVPVTLTLRELSTPTLSTLLLHLLPFSMLALFFIAVFFSAGLYDPVTAIVRRELPASILGTQVINILIAALFFFFVPVFGITPKTNLLIYLLVSVLFVSIWHFAVPLFARRNTGDAVLVGDGAETEEVLLECKSGSYPFKVTTLIPVSGRSRAEIAGDVVKALDTDPMFLIMDVSDDRLQSSLAAFSLRHGVDTTLINFTDMYEGLFRRVPLSSLSHQWFLSEERPERALYSLVKRGFDILLGLLLSLVFILVVPLVWLLLTIEGRGPLFVRQKRMGRSGGTISVLKFRTMTGSEEGVWLGETKNRVTRVGAFLRKTSLDELPQVLSVLTGGLSLIGPRSDIAVLAGRLAESIPFYMLRYSVTPGISGWAQVNQRYSPGNISPQSIEESRIRLAYDLYYVKHRSPLLDLSITLRTLKTLIARWVA